MTSYLTIAGMLGLVLLPLLIPTAITAVHAIRRSRPSVSLPRTARYPRRTAPRRGAVPAAT
jgi:ABC-type transport system involved in cytochrome c biogenesis permease component